MVGNDLLLRLRIRPRTSPEGIEAPHAGRLRVRVSAPPVEGSANERLMQILAREFDVPRSALVLTRGMKSRDKDIVVRAAAARHAAFLSRAMERSTTGNR